MGKVLITMIVFIGMVSAIPAAYVMTKDTKSHIVACKDNKDKDTTKEGDQGTKS